MFCHEYCRILENSCFYRTPPVHYTFPEFYVMIELFGRFWEQNWHLSYLLCNCFVLFRTCFHSKIFSKCNFCTYCSVGSSTILIESLKFRNNSRITLASPSNLLWKLNIVFLDIMLCYYFCLEAVLQGVANNNPTEKQIIVEIQVMLKHAPAWKFT